MNGPVLPRRRLPARYGDGDAPAEFDETPESRYRRVYFEVIDKLTVSMKILVIIRRQWPWIASSEIMFVNYFWCKGFGRNHRDNVNDWINLQRKQCIKEAT